MKLFFNRKPVLVFYTIVLFFYLYILKTRGKLTASSDEELNNFINSVMVVRNYYYTLWNFSLQIIFLCFAIGDELATIFQAPLGVLKLLKRCRSHVFVIWVFPNCLLVASLFWSIYFVDRNLVYPPMVDQIVPSWLNHILHTFILVPLAVEMCLSNSQYSAVRFSHAFVGLSVFLLIYQALYLSVFYRYGMWLYPIHATLTWTQRFFFLIVNYSAAIIFLKIGVVMHDSRRTKIK